MANYEETIVRTYTKYTEESFGSFGPGDKTFLKKNSDGKLVLHRTDGPAVEYSSGDKHWYCEGNLHRTDGPAVEQPNGYKAWYFNGKPHRTDGPAVDSDGYKAWYFEGKRHRTDGPTIEYCNGDKEWWIEGKQYSEEEFKKKVADNNL